MREYKTQMEAAKKGIITPEMQTVGEGIHGAREAPGAGGKGLRGYPG